MEVHAVKDDGKPTLTILWPAMDAVVNSPNVVVKLSVGRNIGGHMLYRTTDLSGPHSVVDPGEGYAEGKVEVTLDGQLCHAIADPVNPLELRNLPPGNHTLQAFVLKSTDESYKNEGAFKMVTFTVTGAGYISPATSGRAPVLTSPFQCLAPAPGRDPIDPKKPLLLYNRPLGDNERDSIMIDFWILNAKLKGDGGDFRVRYFIDDDEARYIDKWEPIWLNGWTPGKHSVRLELLGADQYPVKNGIVTREITVVR